MLNFFRKIRQNSLEEKRSLKYVFYVLGEILLVVVGILIALQVNNWNEERKQQQVEIKLLKEIQNDLEVTLDEVNGDLESHIKALRRGNEFKSLLMTKEVFDNDMAKLFSDCLNDRQVYPKIGGYESMRSKGMDIISNDSLRLKITDLYETSLIRLVEFGRSNEQNNISKLLSPYYKKHFTLSDKITKLDEVEGISESVAYYKYQIISLEDLKNDHSFLIDLQDSFLLRNKKINRHQDVIIKTSDVLENIIHELENLK